MAKGVLSGFRVLDFGRYIAAPFCAALLADLGAEVIRVESLDGNDDRFVMPVSEAGGALFLQVNRNKLSLPVAMRHEQAQALLRRLVASSDVVVTNMVPKVQEEYGLDYISLCAVKPDIILANVTAFGADGPERNRTGFDGTGQAMSGAMSLSGWPGQPMRAAVSYIDYGTALACAFGTVAALLARGRTGEGQEVKASLLGTALTMMNPILIEQASGRRVRTATGNRSPIAGPSDVFATADGWIMVQVIGQAMFRRWTALVGAPALADDPRFASDIQRGENGTMLSEQMARWCLGRSTADCLDALRHARIPGCPILSPAEALARPQLGESGLVDWMAVAGLDEAVPLVSPVSLSKAGAGPARPAPSLGRGALPFLRDVGFTLDEVAALQRDGVIRLQGDDMQDMGLAGSHELVA